MSLAVEVEESVLWQRGFAALDQEREFRNWRTAIHYVCVCYSAEEKLQLDFVDMIRVRDERRRNRHVETLRRQKEEEEGREGGEEGREGGEEGREGGEEGRVELLGDVEEGGRQTPPIDTPIQPSPSTPPSSIFSPISSTPPITTPTPTNPLERQGVVPECVNSNPYHQGVVPSVNSNPYHTGASVRMASKTFEPSSSVGRIKGRKIYIQGHASVPTHAHDIACPSIPIANSPMIFTGRHPNPVGPIAQIFSPPLPMPSYSGPSLTAKEGPMIFRPLPSLPCTDVGMSGSPTTLPAWAQIFRGPSNVH
ncbi:unnamed protein product [Coregonus sp. 'balchen']|nr:unnamed protein product [Coregonus sp. 'balchen']